MISLLLLLFALSFAGASSTAGAVESAQTFAEYEDLLADMGKNNGATTPKQATPAPNFQTWPEYVPAGPFYFDTDCFGRFVDKCTTRAGAPYCKWYTSQDPTCYDTRYVSVTVPVQDQIPYHVRFFQFNYGVHLVEGTFFKKFYSLTVDECARLCLKSASGFPSFPTQRIRCMSFDFYPFETWMEEAPYYESRDKGVCHLNSETKDTARIRNEDQGFTDAEFYYKSHCTFRPFNRNDGYYEVRDPRGTLSPLLEYAGPSSAGLESPWGGSRWGIFHPNAAGYLPTYLTPQLVCDVNTPSDEIDGPVFRGGFTPVNDEQHCPGLMTKTETKNLCKERGGDLCLNQADLNAISGRKLGCSFDQAGNGQIWHEGIPDKGQKMWPRCCASYIMPLSSSPVSVPFQDSCKPYEQPNIDFCGSFKTVTECLYTQNMEDPQSKYPQHWLKGFGKGLDEIRNICKARSEGIPGYSCSQMDVSEWRTVTNCIWCPQDGLLPIGGNGQCRAGGDYGVCPTGSNNQRSIFGLRARSTCPELTNCGLISSYPDLAPFMGNYTFLNFTGSPTTASPLSNENKVSKRPSNSPTRFPTKKGATKYPTTMFERGV